MNIKKAVNQCIPVIAIFLVPLFACGQAFAFAHANIYGGRTAGTSSSWSHTGRYGGTASGGGGSWSGTGARGGTASGGGGSWSAKGEYGGHASGRIVSRIFRTFHSNPTNPVMP